MKLRLNLSENQAQQQQPDEQGEGWGSYLNRNILTPAARSLGAQMGGIPQRNYGEELTEKFVPGITEKTGGAPKGFASQESPDMLLGTLSSLAVPGALAVKAGGKIADVVKSAVGSLLGGEVGAGAAKFAGAPEKVQQIAGTLGSIGGGAYGRQVGANLRPSGVFSRKAYEHGQIERPKKIEKLKSDVDRLYAVADRQAKDYKFPAQDVRTAMNKLREQASFGVDEADQKKIYSTLSQADDLIQKGSMNVANAIKFVQNRNKAVYDQNMTPVVKQYNKQIISDLNDFIDRAGAKKPLFGKAYEKAKLTNTEMNELKDIQYKQGKLTYDQYQKQENQRSANELIGQGLSLLKSKMVPGAISTVIGWVAGKTAGGAAAGTYLSGKYVQSEFKKVNAILKENPGLKNDLIALEKAAVNRDKGLTFTILDRINNRFEIQEEDKAKQTNSPRKLSFR